VKKSHFNCKYLFLLLILLTVNASFSQSISQLQKKADESFKKKDYNAALIDFRQLLAQNPTSMDFNYKYGVCVFYSDNRKNAKRYFDFVLRQPDFPSETYYFVAKLSHFEYKFTNAMLYYQKYLDNTPEKLRGYDVKTELDQCANGKTLLKSPKALRLINAVEVAIPKFYMNYQLESRTGGFFTDEALQTKMDKKFNHLPMYYFLRGDSLKFFASYGATTNKDIYFVRKLGADMWSPAIKLDDQVNSLLDEDFPFYDQKNGMLFFSSRGHNSIGGYDLFKSKFDPSNNKADNTSNLDFPYSSAADDFLFVPEIDQKKACFSSNRNCERNKIEVYSVEYNTINSTIQLIKGDFHDLLDEKNKMAQIKVINVNTLEEFGPFTTDENGKYSLLIPGSGDYKFSVTVDGSRETFIGTATVPVAKSNTIFKQSLTYSVVESDEHMDFANYFNLSELASEDDKIIVLNAIASLKMNPTLIQNNSASLTKTVDAEAVLTELGYDNMDQKDALSKLNDDLISVELLEEELSIDVNKAVLLQKENVAYLGTLDNLIKEVKTDANDPNISSNDKKELLEKLKEIQEDKIEIQQQMIALNQLIEQKETALKLNQQLELTKKAAELNEKLIDLSLLNSEDSTKLFLVDNKETIQSLFANSVTNETEKDLTLLEQELVAKSNLLQIKRTEIKKEIDSLNNSINELEKSKSLASKKEKIGIDQEIIALQKKVNESSTAQNIIINDLLTEEQALYVEIAKIELKEELKNNNVTTSDSPINEGKIELPAISLDDITTLTEEKNEVDIMINQLNKENEALIESPQLDGVVASEAVLNDLTGKIDGLKKQADSQQKYQAILNLLVKKELELQSTIKKSEASNDFLTVNKYMEELQSVKSEQEKYTANLADLVASEKEEQLTAEEKLAANQEKLASEDQIAANAEKKRIEEELAAKQEKLSSEEQIAANAEKKRVEEELANIEKKRIEEELAAKQEKLSSEEQIAANAEKKRVEEELANIEKKRIEEELAASQEKLTSEEQIAANAEKKRVEEEIANIEKKRVEEELAKIEKKRIEEELATKQEKLTSEEQLATNLNPKTAEEQLEQINSPNSTELIKVMEATKEVEKSSLSTENKTLDQENNQVLTIINSTNTLLLNQLVLSNKIKSLEEEFPALELIHVTSNDEARNALLIQEKLLEEIRKKETGEKLALMDKQLGMIKNEINQLENNQQVIPIIKSDNFLKDNALTETDIVELKSKPEYMDYLQKRIAYNRTNLMLDSINKVITSEKQKLDYLMQQSNGNATISNTEREKAKSITESLLLADKLTQQLTEEEKRIVSLPNQSKMEAMLAEKIEPIQLIAKTTAPSYDFVVGNPVTINTSIPLPVLSKSPSGLLYRIQVGAFRKPIAVDKFREFTPVSGEVLQNGLTCYLAGYFNNKINALTARKSIRNLGYADAFIVAYCDGKRISLFEAAELERSGRCIAKTQNEISIEVAELFKNSEVVPEISSELTKEAVFYCVQVGVYNKPIVGKQLTGIEELESHISPNGQYHYTSGQFIKLEDAKLRKKDIVQKGITDAYIVAYRNGKPIDMNLAKTLIRQQEQVASEQIVPVEQAIKIDFNQLAAPAILNVEYVQFIKKMDTEISNELLGGLNRGGTFVFDPNQKCVVSGFISLSDISAFERIYFADMAMVEKPSNATICVVSADERAINSAMHDWLLHCTIPYSILPKMDTFEIQFILSNDNQLTTIKEMADKLDYTYKLSQL
jgi:hypothetical protein